MEWTQRERDDIDFGLNEARVCAVRYEPSTATARVYIEVVALLEAGPIDPDPRRVLILSGVTSMEFRLRPDTETDVPSRSISSIDAIERLLSSTQVLDGMYGWKFLDIEDPISTIRSQPGLIVGPGPWRTGHTLDWFAELVAGGTDERQRLDGTIYFRDLLITRADGAAQSPAEFDADASRYWNALHSRDPRLSSPSQKQASTDALRWRPPHGVGQLIPAG